jgi:hypothetical protein
MGSFKIELELIVSQNWVDDGFDPTMPHRVDEVKAFFENWIGWATPSIELKVRNLSIVENVNNEN